MTERDLRTPPHHTPAPDGPSPGATAGDDPPQDDRPPGRPRASRRQDVVALVLLLAGAGLAVAAVVAGLRVGDGDASEAPTTAWSVDGVDLDRYAADLLAAADGARRAAGRPAWEAAPCAQPAAAERAAALVGEELVHAPLDPVLAACAPLTTVAENLSRAAAPPAGVVEAWLGSPGHRANIEDPTLTQAATACVLDDGQVLCALVLAGP